MKYNFSIYDSLLDLSYFYFLWKCYIVLEDREGKKGEEMLALAKDDKQMVYFSADMKHLPRIALIDDVTISAPYVHYRRKPEEYILYYIYDGEMYLTEGDTEYVLTKRDILILDPRRVHYGRKTSTCHYLYLHFCWEDMKEENISEESLLQFRKCLRDQNAIFENKDIGSQRLVLPKYWKIPDAAAGKFAFLLEQMQSQFHNGMEYRQEMTAALCLQFFIEYARILNDEYNENTSKSMNQMISNIITYIYRYYPDEITSRDISRRMHGNYNYINRKFKEYTGRTIMNFLNEYRVYRSRELLATGLYTHKQIAAEVGFCNEFYFSRVFKKVIGISPSVYAKGVNRKETI